MLLYCYYMRKIFEIFKVIVRSLVKFETNLIVDISEFRNIHCKSIFSEKLVKS